jgi:hypothetical protein
VIATIRRLLLAGAAAAVLAAPVAAAIPASAATCPPPVAGHPVVQCAGPVVPRATAGQLWTNDGHPTSFALHAHSSGGQLTIAGSSLQNWHATDEQLWNNLSGGVVGVFQIQLSGTNLCATWNSVGGGIYANTCQNDNSHPGQLFWWDPDGTGGYWLINERASDANGTYVFMTAVSESNNAVVNGQFAGAGGRAQWAFI